MVGEEFAMLLSKVGGVLSKGMKLGTSRKDEKVKYVESNEVVEG